MPEVPVIIQLEDSDLTAPESDRIRAVAAGEQILAESVGFEGRDATRKAVMDLLPGVVARKLDAITPKDFRVTEMKLTISLGGKLHGIGVSGDVEVIFAPAKP